MRKYIAVIWVALSLQGVQYVHGGPYYGDVTLEISFEGEALAEFQTTIMILETLEHYQTDYTYTPELWWRFPDGRRLFMYGVSIERPCCYASFGQFFAGLTYYDETGRRDTWNFAYGVNLTTEEVLSPEQRLMRFDMDVTSVNGLTRFRTIDPFLVTRTLDVPPFPIIAGDSNLDGRVDFGDLSSFVLFLTNPSALDITLRAGYPFSCDVNLDARCNFNDLVPLVELLSGGGAAGGAGSSVYSRTVVELLSGGAGEAVEGVPMGLADGGVSVGHSVPEPSAAWLLSGLLVAVAGCWRIRGERGARG